MITTQWNGRLGNNLFQAAAVIGLAHRCKHAYVFPRWKYSHAFHRPLPQDDNYHVSEVYQEKGFPYQEIPCSRGLELNGYWQSSKYFEHCKDLVLSYFKPSGSLQDWVNDSRPKDPVTGIHIRRGDYLKYEHYYHNLFQEGYYQRSLDLLGNPTNTIVFSDDIPWCRENFKANFYSTGTEVEDLFLLSSCNQIIMANSSFSWWSSYLSRARVIAPKNWFKSEAGHDTKDLLLPTWELV